MNYYFHLFFDFFLPIFQNLLLISITEASRKMPRGYTHGGNVFQPAPAINALALHPAVLVVPVEPGKVRLDEITRQDLLETRHGKVRRRHCRDTIRPSLRSG